VLYRFFVFTLAGLLLSACSHQARSPLDSPAQGDAGAIEQWALNGKLGIAAQDPRGKSLRQSANINWQQDREGYSIHLSGPLGQGSTQIKSDSGGVTLKQAGQADIHAASANELLLNTLGYTLPLDALYYWARGIPSPVAPPELEQRSVSGDLSQLKQLGWQLDYSPFQDVMHWQLPRKIIASKGSTRITLIIKKWRLP